MAQCGRGCQIHGSNYTLFQKTWHLYVYDKNMRNPWQSIAVNVKELVGTHRVWTHAVLLLTVNLTLTFQPKTMSLVRYPKVIPYTKFEHFGIIHSWVMLQTLVLTLTLILTFDLSTQNHTSRLLQDISRSFPISTLNTLWSFVFELCSGH